MRDINTPMEMFRRLLEDISYLMAYAVSENLPVMTRRIQTPIVEMDAPCLDHRGIVIVPVLRAGLGMIQGLEKIFPEAALGYIGVFRDHDTHQPVEYIVKLPKATGQKFILVDPMLATGHSSRYATDVLIKNGVLAEDITFMALVAAPEGVRHYHATYPQIPIYTASLDSHLNEKAYIVPGLGDAGDRLFGTS